MNVLSSFFCRKSSMELLTATYSLSQKTRKRRMGAVADPILKTESLVATVAPIVILIVVRTVTRSQTTRTRASSPSNQSTYVFFEFRFVDNTKIVRRKYMLV